MLTDKQKLETKALSLLSEIEKRHRYNQLKYVYWQDRGVSDMGARIDRELYVKHLEAFKLTTEYRELCLLSGNRTGKTQWICSLISWWATGDYPEWFEGRRFPGPTRGWVVCPSADQQIEGMQMTLLGDEGDWGTGLIPKDAIVPGSIKKFPNTSAVRSFSVYHKNGGQSKIRFKTCQQELMTYMGATLEWAAIDEEVDMLERYYEILQRTMTTKGIVVHTFTPLKQLSPVVRLYLNNGRIPPDGITRDISGKPTGRRVINISWDDAPHLTAEMKKDLEKSYPAYQLAARKYGIPSIGEGVIYPFNPESYLVEPFPIPDYWKRAFAIDYGITCTAVLWGAKDPDTGILYIYAEYFGRKTPISVNIDAMLAKGHWIPGIGDYTGPIGPDAVPTRDYYLKAGFRIVNAKKEVEPGISRVYNAFQGGMIKIFSTLHELVQELAEYRRDTKGDGQVIIVKENDHGCDDLRYLMEGFDRVATTEYMWEREQQEDSMSFVELHQNRNNITGY